MPEFDIRTPMDIIVFRGICTVLVAVALYFWSNLAKVTRSSTNIPAIRMQSSLGWVLKVLLGINIYLLVRIAGFFHG